MATCEERLEVQRRILQKIYYAGEDVTSDSALKESIDNVIEDMLTSLNCCSESYDTADVIKLRLDVTSASETLIMGVEGKKILVVQAHITADATSNDIIFYSAGAVDTELYGPSDIDTSPLELQPSTWGWFETLNGEDLKIEKTGGNLGGVLGYVLIDADVVS